MTIIVQPNLPVNAASRFEDVRARVFAKALVEYMTSNKRKFSYEASDSCLSKTTQLNLVEAPLQKPQTSFPVLLDSPPVVA